MYRFDIHHYLISYIGMALEVVVVTKGLTDVALIGESEKSITTR